MKTEELFESDNPARKAKKIWAQIENLFTDLEDELLDVIKDNGDNISAKKSSRIPTRWQHTKVQPGVEKSLQLTVDITHNPCILLNVDV